MSTPRRQTIKPNRYEKTLFRANLDWMRTRPGVIYIDFLNHNQDGVYETAWNGGSGLNTAGNTSTTNIFQVTGLSGSTATDRVVTGGGAVAFGRTGLIVTTADTQYNWIAIIPQPPSVANLKTLFSNGTSASVCLAAFSGAITTDQDGLEFDYQITTGAAVTTCEVMAGLMGADHGDCGFGATTTKGNTIPTAGFYFYYDAATSGNWLAAYHTGNPASSPTDVTVDTGVAVTASTTYELSAVLDADRVPHFYINGVKVAEGAALFASTNLGPMVGVKTAAAATRSLTLGPSFIKLGE
jgi:hypothetical protein